MTPEELRKIIEETVKDGVSFNLLLISFIYLIIFALGIFFGSFLRKKGEDLATKQDIGAITKIVEEIRSHFTSRQQLRMAALERRLDVHQKAYKLWTELISADKENIAAKAYECQQWWYENNLFLEPEVREAFKKGYKAASVHPKLLEHRLLYKDIEENWNKVHRVGKIIEEAIRLPEITETKKI